MRVKNSEALIQDYVEKFGLRKYLNEQLIAQLELFHFPAYSYVYVEEDEQHILYFLVEGQVQCHHYHLNGNLAVIALSNPFAAIGDLEILTEERVDSNVIATQDSVMLGIARPHVERYGANDPRFLRFLIEQLREKLYRSNNLQISHLLPLIKRFSLYILAQPRGDKPLVHFPEKEVLASLMGTTPRHLNRVMKQLVDEGIISASYPCVQILNRPALEDLACDVG